MKLENDTVWLSQNQMAELFGRDRTVIAHHINNCFKEGELDKNITCAKFAHMGVEGDQLYGTTLYNLDLIISVGYRVKSIQGTRFRQWANSILKQYLIKGHAINQQRLDHYSELKEKFGSSQWFANPKDDSFRSSLGQICQTFGGEDLYPSVEEKAVMVKVVVNLINKENL